MATGDGVALAYRAGAEIMDMEFFQFHPTALRLPGVQPVPHLRGGARRGRHPAQRCGRPLHAGLPSPRRSWRPATWWRAAIVAEMKKTGADHVFLDVTHLPPRGITARFPQIYRFCLDHGLDITQRA